MRMRIIEGKPNYRRKSLYHLDQANTYLQNLVQTKSFFKLIILVVISFTTVYSPYINIVRILVKDINIILRDIVTSLFFILPVTLVFLLIMREQRKMLFKKVTVKQYKKSVFYALFVICSVLLTVCGITTFTTYKASSNPGTDVSLISLLLKIPTISIQLIGENIMFISFLLFWYKIFQFTKCKTPLLLGLSLLFSSLSFGLLHLSTYSFNWIQCVLIIGIPAASHMILFLRYNNVHLGYWMHLNYDLFVMMFVFIGTLFSKR